MRFTVEKWFLLVIHPLTKSPKQRGELRAEGRVGGERVADVPITPRVPVGHASRVLSSACDPNRGDWGKSEAKLQIPAISSGRTICYQNLPLSDEILLLFRHDDQTDQVLKSFIF